jgi:hypothetical protein
MSKSDLYRWLADAVLAMHFGFVAFVIGGLVLIWVGFVLRWSWVRGFWFRVAHLLAMAVVLAESVGGVICPLTAWEDGLRSMAGGGAEPVGSFIQRWIHRVLFYDVNETTLAVVYAGFFALIVASLWLVKPRWRGDVRRQSGEVGA